MSATYAKDVHERGRGGALDGIQVEVRGASDTHEHHRLGDDSLLQYREAERRKNQKENPVIKLR